MSLWRQRSAIERAVGGQLSAEDEARLRNHLQGCLECRRYYDAVSVQARILAGDPHTTSAASEREMARLMAALNPAPKPVDVPAWWSRFAVAASVAAAMLFGILSWRQSVPQDEIAWRGDSKPASAAPEFGLWVVTAPQDGGEVRRDLAFPSDALARVHANEWVAFAKKGNARVEFFRVVLVNETGQTMVLKSGQSVALDLGRWRAFGLGGDPLEDPVLIAAAREAGVGGKSLKLPTAFQASGVIVVQP